MDNAIGTKFMFVMTGINTRDQQKAALSLANALRLRGIMSVFALRSGSLFTKIFSERGYEVIDVPTFPESNSFFANILRTLKLQSYVQEVMKTLEVKSINGVIGFGGMSAYPILDAAAKMKKVKLFLFDGNLVISKCNSSFIKKADRLYFPFEVMQETIDYEFYKKSFIGGIPVDKEVLKANSADFQTKKRKLVILTCKKDAKDINETVRDFISKYPEITKDFYIVHETGDRDIAAVQRYYETNKIEHNCEMFFENRGVQCKAADIVIARPDSDIISELIALEKPAIYLPLPEDKDPYQKQNAVFMAKKSLGYIVEDVKSVNSNVRLRKIYSFLNSYLKNEYNMKKNMAELDFANSANRLADDIEKILKNGK